MGRRPVRVKQGALSVSRDNLRERLIDELTPAVYDRFQELWVDSRLADDPTEDFFGLLMTEVATWPQEAPDALDVEVSALEEVMPRLTTYLHLIIVSHVMSAAAIRFGEKPENVRVELPDVQLFVHYIYTLCSQWFDTHQNLLSTNVDARTARKNRTKAETIIRQCIGRAVNRMIPTDQIIDDYLVDLLGDYNDDDDDEEVEEVEVEVEVEDNKPPPALNPLKLDVTSDDLPHADMEKKVVIKREEWSSSGAAPDKTVDEARLQEEILMDGIEDEDLE